MFKTISDGRLPERATKYSAAFDVFANETVVIGTGETKLVPLGIAIDHAYVDAGILSNYYFELHPRSSVRLKGVGGGIGVIDIDYKDEIKIVLTAPSSKLFSVKRGDKIGQMVLMRHEGHMLPPEYTLQVERSGGLGSTGE